MVKFSKNFFVSTLFFLLLNNHICLYSATNPNHIKLSPNTTEQIENDGSNNLSPDDGTNKKKNKNKNCLWPLAIPTLCLAAVVVPGVYFGLRHKPLMPSLAELPTPSPTAIRDMFPQIIRVAFPTISNTDLEKKQKENSTGDMEPDVIFRTRQLTRIESILQNTSLGAKDKLLEFHNFNLASTVHLNIDTPQLQQMSEADFGELFAAEVEKIKEGLELISKAYTYFGPRRIAELFTIGQGGCFNATITYLQDQYVLDAHPEMALFIPNLSINDDAKNRFFKLFTVYLNRMAEKELLQAGEASCANAIDQVRSGRDHRIDKHLNVKSFLEWGIKNGYISYTKIKSDGSPFEEQFKPMITKDPGRRIHFCVSNATAEAITYFNLCGYDLDSELNGVTMSSQSDLDITNILKIDVTEKQ